MTSDERLLQFLKDGRDWERKSTNLPGVFLLRLPSFRGKPASIAIEINPVSTSGSPTKKRGIVIRSASELDEINRLLSNPKVINLAKNVDEVNPEKKTYASGATEDVFEV
jgi:hypothetical protein